jgi:hypothetical protein
MAGRTIIAKHIIATAKAGNLNRQSLADGALLYLAKQKLHGKPPNGTLIFFFGKLRELWLHA